MSATRRLTAATRVALAVVMVMTIGAATISLIAYTSVATHLWNSIDRNLINEADAFEAAIGGDPQDELGIIDISRGYLEARSESSGGRNVILLAVFENGKVLSNSSIALETMADNPAAASPMTAEMKLSHVTNENMTFRVLSVPIMGAEDERMGVFQSAIATDETEKVLSNLALALGSASLVVIALASLMSVWVASKVLHPLREMADTAALVSTTSLHERVGYDGPADELGVMASALDSMLDRLESSFREQKRFIADASHELRTPLTIISGHLEAAQDQTDAEERAESLDIACDEVARMSRLVGDLLALARLDAGPPRSFQPLHIPTLLQETAHRANSIGARSVSVNCVGEMWVMGDPDLLERAITNLLMNAFQHTPESATVTLACEKENDNVQVRVMDDGPGIAIEDLPRLFDRFYRARDSRGTGVEGAGLGLAIVQGLISLHAGTVHAENGTNGGAVFTIWLPSIPSPE